MQKLILFLALGALAGLAACSKEAGQGAATAAAPAGPIACVKDVPDNAVCTMDVNSCGHAGQCACGAGYVYDGAIGMCVLDLKSAGGQAMKTPVPDNDCVRPAKGACTKDLNACGQPSHCDCDEGYDWNAAAGKCVRHLS